MIKKLFALLLILSVFNVLDASGVKRIELNTFQEFCRGTLISSSIDHQGRLFIGPRVSRIKGPESEYYLALDMTPGGDILLGAGHGATAYRISGSTGKSEKIFENDRLDIYSILASSRGDIFVATSPNGSLYRIGKDKKAVKLFSPREKFIWDLEEDDRGNLICAVGGNGGVYRVSPKGDGVKILEADDAHVVSLFTAKDGAILAGSGNRGILYRIVGNKAKIVFDSPFEEVRGICQNSKGDVYFAATRKIRRPKSKSVKKEELIANGSKPGKNSTDKSALYRLRPDGSVEQIWSSDSETVYDLCCYEKKGGVLVATGNSGRVYHVSENGGFALVHENQSAQVYAIHAADKGAVLLTNNTAGLYRMEYFTAAKADYISQVFDMEVKSRLGRLFWRLEQGSVGVATVLVRTGNSSVPDSTWTDWSPPFTDPNNSSIAVSGFRYVQLKISLNSANLAKTPYVNQVRAYYQQNNLSPRIAHVAVAQPDSGTITVNDQDLTAEKGEVKVAVLAGDPNDDKLKASFYLKKTTDSRWILFKKDLSDLKVTIDSAMLEDGNYQCRVVVDDELSNPPGMAARASRVSKIFTLDSTAPVMQNFTAADTEVTFSVKDVTSPVKKVCFSRDTKLWYPLHPIDGINDSLQETYKINNRDLGSRGIVYFFLSDEMGNFKIVQKLLK